MVEDEIDQDAGDGNVHPQRPSPSRDFAVEVETLFERAVEGDQNQGHDHDR